MTLAALLAATLLAGCGDDDSAGRGTATAPGAATAAMATDSIRIEDFAFDPSPATVTAGQRISVSNGDDAPHTLTEQPRGGDALFDSGTLRRGQTAAFTAPKPGAYRIYCVIHPFMKGEIRVAGASG